MRIIFTGSSSFTGYWLIKALVEAGHEVLALLSRDEGYYTGVRAERVAALKSFCRPVPSTSFGSAAFFELLAGMTEPCNLLCHHAAEVTDYKSDDFDALGAAQKNCCRLKDALASLRDLGCDRVVLTGSVFEPGEGAGSEGLRGFSPYGVSKGLTAEIFRYYVPAAGMSLGKFVIANPFGPLEEPRLTHYLINNWLTGKSPEINTPLYVRDNIHVRVLARAYVTFVEEFTRTTGFVKTNPSGEIGTIGSFVEQLAREVRCRTGLPCDFSLARQTDFREPVIRTNTDPTHDILGSLGEDVLYDELVSWYRSQI
jgi:nucleoside-diphosphate-sugar epimerase